MFRGARKLLLLAAMLLAMSGGGSPLRAQDASQPYLGQIMLVAFDFVPRGWAECAGQLLPINQNQALFSLLGTTYGGNGTTTFALPDLRGRVPVQAGSPSGIVLGERSGQESHTLSVGELPAHTHGFAVSSVAATALSPAGAVPAVTGDLSRSYAPAPAVTMHPGAIAPAGGSQPHENRMPTLALRYIIALQGIYPSQN
jgi:microcystin-dependent protein